jgi:hypothetical protein
MTNIMKVGVVISLILCGDVCIAEDHNSDKLARTLMLKSGMKKQIEQMPQLLQSELDQQQANATGITQEEFNRFSNIVRAAFDAKAIHADAQTYIKLNLSENDMKEVLEWLDSPLGTKITKLEEEGSTAKAYEDMQAIGPMLLHENKNSARLNKLIKLDKAIGVTQSSANTVLNIQLAMITAMSAAMEVDKRPSFEDVQELVKKNQPQIHAAMSQMVQIQFLYSYRELTDHEIDRYIQFAESMPGQRYHNVSIRAIDEALVHAARRIGSRLGMRMIPI